MCEPRLRNLQRGAAGDAVSRFLDNLLVAQNPDLSLRKP
jgi:hypothetical protein